MAILPTELRIGSYYIDQYDNEFKLTFITDDDISNRLSGIPITKELLVEKCGGTEEKEMIWIELETDFDIVFHNDTIGISIYDTGTRMYQWFSHIKYLHQLQNLIMSLTGEELKVSL